MRYDSARALTSLTTDTYLPLIIFRKLEEFQTVILADLVTSVGMAFMHSIAIL
jgi:hypothetical protein